jgi:hypothetical protein
MGNRFDFFCFFFLEDPREGQVRMKYVAPCRAIKLKETKNTISLPSLLTVSLLLLLPSIPHPILIHHPSNEICSLKVYFADYDWLSLHQSNRAFSINQ